MMAAMPSTDDSTLLPTAPAGMSGNGAMAIVRAGPGTADIPVIALSANAMQHDVAKSRSLGFFRYLSKPINVDEFFDVLDDALALPEASMPVRQ